MSSLCEGRVRKRSREAESSRMEEKTTKDRKDDNKCNTKERRGEKKRTTTRTRTRTSSVEKEDGEVHKVEEEDEKKDAAAVPEKLLQEESSRGWDEWAWCWSIEEERMLREWSWPDSDLELIISSTTGNGWVCDEDEEVLWEDDVWHLKDIKEIPNP